MSELRRAISKHNRCHWFHRGYVFRGYAVENTLAFLKFCDKKPNIKL